ncbi:MAG: 2-oxo acid dehydrogenase subunit E2 [Armatimonadetes bacterium]|nr:2-oxo acid dehydrogenase subunit E2 [Armatimonadota bacterium]
MPITEVLVPQLGEGLQEVKVIRFLKQPGETIKRDEHFYEMETDKAVVEVESPYDGTLTEWLAGEGDVLAIGAPIAKMETAEAVAAPAAHGAPVSHAVPTAPVRTERPAAGDVVIPPRTRAHAKSLGLTEDELRSIPSNTGKLMPEDVDAFVSARGSAAVEVAGEGYTDRPVPAQQRTFMYRVKRSSQIVVPGTIDIFVPWKNIRGLFESLRKEDVEVQPSEFVMAAFCIAQSAKNHTKFRSTLVGEETIREWDHLNMGIAVARPSDELVTAVVNDADALEFVPFARAVQSQVRRAREGQDQASMATQMLVTYMGAHNIVAAVPVLVSPAVSVVFIGAAHLREGQLMTTVGLTFDHRLINGVGAANFLNEIGERMEKLERSELGL